MPGQRHMMRKMVCDIWYALESRLRQIDTRPRDRTVRTTDSKHSLTRTKDGEHTRTHLYSAERPLSGKTASVERNVSEGCHCFITLQGATSHVRTVA
jgi:hypothetical protein